MFAENQKWCFSQEAQKMDVGKKCFFVFPLLFIGKRVRFKK
jgi:hypothetical protein